MGHTGPQPGAGRLFVPLVVPGTYLPTFIQIVKCMHSLYLHSNATRWVCYHLHVAEGMGTKMFSELPRSAQLGSRAGPEGHLASEPGAPNRFPVPPLRQAALLAWHFSNGTPQTPD